mmetsp:Transcript_26709/g.83667  ORF Transcript_26709/g.83667 Transcript_26709/m.83667 type:complete len:710 (+) Transcript_26709:541-2670(+)
MSRSQAAVLRAYAAGKLRDALNLLDEARISDEDLLRRRDILAEFLENGAFAGVAPQSDLAKLAASAAGETSSGASDEDQQELLRLRREVEELRANGGGGSGGGDGEDSAAAEALRKENAELRAKLKKKKAAPPPPSAPPPPVASPPAGSGAASAGELTALEAANAKLQAKNTKLAGKVEELEGELEALRSNGASASAEGALKDKEIRKLKKKYKELQETTEKEKEELMDCMAQELEEVEQKAVKEKEQLKRKVQKLKSKLTGNKEVLRNMAGALKSQLAALKKQKDGILRDVRLMPTLAGDTASRISRAVGASMDNIEELKTRYQQEAKERKRLHNLVQELRGNIRVYCRVRPPNRMELEQGNGAEICATFPGEGEVALQNERGKAKKWEFDQVFDFNSTQPQVYKEVSGLVTSVLDGYNVCIFAYGQTGSGKTYTMEGPPEDRGVNMRALQEIFNVQAERTSDVEYKFKISMMEIYNEQVRDLLETDADRERPGEPRRLDIRQTAKGNVVPGLTAMEVDDMGSIESLMARGAQNRAVGGHNMNERSSRSHSIVRLLVLGKNLHTGEEMRAKLHLIDLAGSERVSKTDATGDRLKEAQNINRSLSALGDVIAALASRNKGHVPFRNSKLTFLLQDSLGGNSKVMMFVNISPAVYNVSETLCSLNFAARCRAVELGGASRNVSSGAGGAEAKEVKARGAGASARRSASKR